jgi:hypothetical protein
MSQTETKQRAEGWGAVANGTKWHYFRESRSLCGGALYLGRDEFLEQGNDGSPDNCAQCKKRLAREKNKAANATA